ncbi:MAG TPA: ClpX C4-type zinc finger protein [Verrucomicrobiae bacterium]|nr:ClpX C4-type zinc finger protein [Verrucomicrobiae bacterium]
MSVRWRRESRFFGLVRAIGRTDAPQCTFCGASAAAVALVAGRAPTQAFICPDCVTRAAAQLARDLPDPAA